MLTFVTLAELQAANVDPGETEVDVAGVTLVRGAGGPFSDAGGSEWTSQDATVNLQMFGAVANDGTDDTVAIEQAITVAGANGFSIEVSAGLYDASEVDVTATVDINFANGAIFDFGGNNGFILRDAGLDLSGATIQNANFAVYGSDGIPNAGSEYPDVGRTFNGSVDKVVITGTTFNNTNNAVWLIMNNTANRLGELRLEDNTINGGYNAITSTAIVGTTLINGNTILDMDPTGFVDPVTGDPNGVGVGGIKLGRNKVEVQDNTGFITITNNTIDGIHDNRAAGYNTQGIAVFGGNGVLIDGNAVKDIDNRKNADAEGIYIKALNAVVSNNTLENAGLEQGAIAIKGGGGVDKPLGDGAQVLNNTIINTRSVGDIDPTYGYDLGDTFAGIYIQASGATVTGNTIDGASSLGTAFSPISTADRDGLDNITINNNTIIGSSEFAIALAHSGDGLEILDNTIEGVYTRPFGFVEGDVVTNMALGRATFVGTDGDDEFTAVRSGDLPDPVGGSGDIMIGKGGNDGYTVDEVSDQVIEVANEGYDRVSTTITYTLLDYFEELQLLDGAGAIDGTGNSAANMLGGNEFDNILDGGAGADEMKGKAGDDTYIVDNVGDTVIEGIGEGVDLVMASVTYSIGDYEIETLELTGTANIDATGNILDNTITGNSGNNSIDGGLGADTMIGGAGDDTYLIRDETDVIIELVDGGNDLVISRRTFSLAGTELEDLTLSGDRTANATGNDKDNKLRGNDFANILDGGLGADMMVGGAGDDNYVVDNIGDIVTEGANQGNDVVSSSISYGLGNNVERLVLSGITDLNGTGNVLANEIFGNAGRNVIDGGGGADVMRGRAGDDVYVVDDAGDQVFEDMGEGTDTVQSSVTFSLVGQELETLILTGSADIDGTGNTQNNTLTGNSGRNVLDGVAGTNTLAGGAGDDIYVVRDETDVVVENAGEGTDTVNSRITYTLAGTQIENLTLEGTRNSNATGNDFDNILIGNGFNNAIDGGVGADMMVGGAGDDNYVVDNIGDTIVEAAGEGFDVVISSISFSMAGQAVERLTLSGVADIDGAGSDDANEIFGNAGRNVIDGGGGADVMRGRAGDDVYVVDDAGDQVFEDMGEGTDTVQSSVTFNLNGQELENLILVGLANIDATGNALDNFLTGNAGDNIFDGGVGDDTMAGAGGNDTYLIRDAGDVVIENANEGTDTVNSRITYSIDGTYVENLVLLDLREANGTGNQLDNTITGNSFNNRLDGLGGADLMIGGAGNDGYFVDNIGDMIVENAAEGNDTVNTTITFSIENIANVEIFKLIGADDIDGVGNSLDNRIFGNNGQNVIFGGAGDDEIKAVNSNDTIYGGLGDDFVFAGKGNDYVEGGDGIDRLLGGIGDDIVLGQDGDDAVLGKAGKDILYGGAGDDGLQGHSGTDQLFGGDGNDILRGGIGNDENTGGSGADIFRFEQGEIGGSTASSTDIILDFNQLEGDKINLKAIDAVSGGTDDKFSFIRLRDFDGIEGQMRYEAVNGDTQIQIDIDGDAVTDLMIVLVGTYILDNSDFVL